MKNLKKVLSLVLALAMAMSLMTTAFATEDFGDADKITKTEAVEVMAALGILEGSNGNFDPQGTLTREQAAKIITYIVLGTTDAEKQAAASAFADVKADRWSASYIAFCASEGYITGMGNNKFAPAGVLTGYQFGKMLLCALGYDATESGLVGDAWQINTGKYLVAEGLDENLEDVDMSKPLARENAAQLALNAMKWSVTPDTYDLLDKDGKIIGTYDSEADANKDAALMTAIAAAKAPYTVQESAKEDTLLKEIYDVDAGRGIDDFGRPANVYALNDKDDTVLTFADDAVATFTGKTAEKAVYSVLTAVKKDVNNDKTIAQVYQDGHAESAITVNKTATDNAPYFGNGVTTEIYKLTDGAGNDYYRAVAVRDYLATVTKVTEANAKNETDRVIEVTLDVVPAGFATNVKATYETENFAKDDVVVVNVAKDGADIVIKSIEKATTVENVTVTAKDGAHTGTANFVANGTTYKLSENSTMTKTNVAGLVLGGDTTYTLYLDTMGNVLKYEVYAETASTDYVQVIAVSTSNSNVDDFDNTAKYHSYKILKMDGTTATVKALDTRTGSAGSYTFTAVAEQNKIYTVSEDKDNAGYVKFTAASGSKSNTVSTAKLDKTQPTIATDIVADANTVFVLTTDTDTYKVYTGIANVPGYTSLSGKTAYAVIDEGYADVIFLDVSAGSAASSAADDLIYLLGNTSTAASYDAANELTIYTYDAIINGVKTTVQSQSASLAANGLVTITKYDSYGYVETVAAASGDLYNAATLTKDSAGAGKDNVTYSAPTLKVNGTTYLTTANTVVYIIDADDELTVGTVADLVGNDAGSMTLIETSDKDATIATIYFDGTID